MAEKNKLESLDSFYIFTDLLDAYAKFLDEIIKLEQEKGIQVLKDSFEEMPNVIETINKKNPILGGRIALWSVKLINVSTNLTKLQTLSLDQKKDLAKQIRLISNELTKIKEDLKIMG